MTEVFNIDCMEYMKMLPDNAFEIAIVDPPYGVAGITGKEFSHGSGKLRKRVFNKENKKINVWDIAPTQKYFDELFRVSRNQIIWGGNYFPLPRYRCFIYWDKVQPFTNFSSGELAWTSFNMPSKQFRFDNRYSGKIHGTQKPVELYKFLLKNFAKKGDKILDTHLGSGSSRIACYDMGFDFVGCEIDKEYFDKQEDRFKTHTAQIELFSMYCGEVVL